MFVYLFKSSTFHFNLFYIYTYTYLLTINSSPHISSHLISSSIIPLSPSWRPPISRPSHPPLFLLFPPTRQSLLHPPPLPERFPVHPFTTQLCPAVPPIGVLYTCSLQIIFLSSSLLTVSRLAHPLSRFWRCPIAIMIGLRVADSRPTCIQPGHDCQRLSLTAWHSHPPSLVDLRTKGVEVPEGAEMADTLFPTNWLSISPCIASSSVFLSNWFLIPSSCSRVN